MFTTILAMIIGSLISLWVVCGFIMLGIFYFMEKGKILPLNLNKKNKIIFLFYGPFAVGMQIGLIITLLNTIQVKK